MSRIEKVVVVLVLVVVVMCMCVSDDDVLNSKRM